MEVIYRQFFHLTHRYSRDNSLPHEDVILEYTDSLLLFDSWVRTQKFKLKNEKSCLNFLMKVLDNRCKNLRRKHDQQGNLFDHDQEIFALRIKAQEETGKEWRTEALMEKFRQLDARCQQILLDWLSGYNMKEIARRNGLSNANVASVSKKRCLEKLKKLFDTEKPDE
ncbi:MAG: sigma-70 family RNA polymerase sigma factor [Bacteroidetes bacterium]|nr:MAG: sigma-70 family RNA polymerase sigma factor [Bacteroidota bacterium]